MRSLESARAQACECRASLGGLQDGLLERLEQHLRDEYRVRVHAVTREFLDGGRGEIDTTGTRPRLNYDRALDADPPKKLELFAHELGHLVLHKRLTGGAVPPDPLTGSAYLREGAAGLARYNPRSREEAEATAFATEFVCPADRVFEDWRTTPGATAATIAAGWGLSAELVRAQLAEGFYRLVTGALAGARDADGETPTNPEQEHAALLKGVPVLVDAGPGTGKTKTLVRRIVHLLVEEGQPPESLLVLTFSREAAEELRTRVGRAVGDPEMAARIEIATFHEFGVGLLYEHGHIIGLPEKFTILDEAVQQETVSRVLGRADCDAILKLKDLNETAEEAARHITFLKDRLCTPAKLAEALPGNPDAPADEGVRQAWALHAVYTAYEEEKATAGAVDFADLILLPIRLLEENEELREGLRRVRRWVMVDEYQDVSRAVAVLLQNLCGPGNPPWVVGDTRQAIYRFRGAAPENVLRFGEDFEGAVVQTLPWNYRSTEAIVAAANHLAALMTDGVEAGSDVPGIWRSAVELAAVEGPPVVMVEADSDRAEYDAVIDLVRAWMQADQAEPGDVAVLARRNIDVRNIALALNRAKVPAVTTGLITAEGAAGDLAAVLSLLDAPRGAVPRLLFRFSQGRVAATVRSEAVRHVLSTMRTHGAFPAIEAPGAEDLVAELAGVIEDLAPLRFSGDGWDVLCEFLFGRGSYLREILRRVEDPEAALALEEILTSLGLAAAHRFTHAGAERRPSRLAFAERFRRALTEPVPGTIAPRGGANAVRVMTCHASKGLEFPFVVVAGQSLPIRKRGYSWLPVALRPKSNDDALQADSLLFVGVTRAQRAVAVSYARTASGSKKATARPLPGLLSRWKGSGAFPVLVRESGPVVKDIVQMGPIWGGDLPATLSTYSFGDNCVIRTYLKEHLGIDFPPGEVEIYPKFVWRVRRVLQRVVELAHQQGTRVDPATVDVLLAEEWPAEDFEGHPHLAIFLPRARVWVRAFAAEYDPLAFPGEVLEPEVAIAAGGEVHSVRGDLVAHVRTPDGRVAVLFRPEVLKLGRGGAAVTWSTLKEPKRLPLVLLWGEDPSLRSYVFSGPAGRIYPYKWRNDNPEEALETELAAVQAAAEAQAAGRFEQLVSEYTCDGCSCRVSCPYWIGALEEDR